MKKRLVFFLWLSCLTASKGQDARSIVAAADRKFKGSSSFSSMTIQIIRPTYIREMTLDAWTLGDDKLLIRITAPAKDRGTAFLRNGKEVWNWIPSIERTIKLPPSMMSQSWMGSDFTNDDLVKEGSIVTDYEHMLEGSEQVQYRECHRIRMTPKANAAVVWGTVVLWIDKKEEIILKARYYDEDGILVNTMTGSDIRNLGGKTLPTRLEMEPADEPGKKTVLIYRELRFDIGTKVDFFNPEKLRQLQ